MSDFYTKSKKEDDMADDMSSESLAVQSFERFSDKFWGRLTKTYFIPQALAIYDELVVRGHDKNNKLYYQDDSVFFVKDKKKKVFVQTTQCLDVMYVLEEDKFPYARTRNTQHNRNDLGKRYDFHIRKLWRNPDEVFYGEEFIININDAINVADSLMECHDDAKLAGNSRPSLNFHIKNQFNFQKDFVDPGFILSFIHNQSNSPRVVGSLTSINELKSVTNHYIRSIFRVLSLKVPEMRGYED
jgi:hypothetical protein